uniref:Cytochrome P450 2C5-like n=1 Tax=Pogona vitticeps TaxID=103695 RepID=A0ABM5GMG8_9SAUR
MDLLGGTTILLIICLTLLVTWKMSAAKKKNLPPGPTPLPFLGNLLQVISSNLPERLRKMSDIYGPVFTLYFGSERVVIAYGYEPVKKVLIDNGDDFLDRGRMPSTDKAGNNLGVLVSNGQRWQQIRRFSLMTMRNFGMGKKSIEEHIQEEAEYLMKALRATKGRPFNPITLFSSATCNIISHILFADRFDYQDEDYIRMLKLLSEAFVLDNSYAGQLYYFIPELMDFLPGPHKTLFKKWSHVEAFVARKVEEHEKTLDPSSVPRDFVDSFLLKMEQEKNNPETEFTRENLMVTINDLFSAGTETTSTTLRYLLMVLAEHQAVQAKVHEEIDRVVGRERPPAMKDRPEMPYTEAVIHEAQRLLNLLPFGLARRTRRDVELEGFTIPKGTSVYSVLGSALRDPKQFKTPYKFDPGHFLDENGSFKKNGADMPFSSGKRNCLGEGLARMELFLYTSNILQSFHVKHPPGVAHIDLTIKLSSFVNLPPEADLCFCPR